MIIHNNSDNTKYFEYTPKEDVDLLIDDVYGKYTLDIVPGRRRRFIGQLTNIK